MVVKTKLLAKRRNNKMKKYHRYVVFCFTILTVLCIMTNLAMCEIRKKNIIATNPFALAMGVVNARYEEIISNKNSYWIEGTIWKYESGAWKWDAYGIGGGYKTFVNPEKSPAGLWWGVGCGLLSMSIEYTPLFDEKETGGMTAFIPSIGGGYSWLIGAKKNLLISVGGGMSYIMGTAEIAGTKVPYGGLTFGIITDIGISW